MNYIVKCTTSSNEEYYLLISGGDPFAQAESLAIEREMGLITVELVYTSEYSIEDIRE